MRGFLLFCAILNLACVPADIYFAARGHVALDASLAVVNLVVSVLCFFEWKQELA